MPTTIVAAASTTGVASDPSVLFVGIVVLAVGLNWLAVRTGVPSILLYLLTGFLAGPVFGVLNPDELLGDLLLPLVSLAVGVILFEGGLSLRLRFLITWSTYPLSTASTSPCTGRLSPMVSPS